MNNSTKLVYKQLYSMKHLKNDFSELLDVYFLYSFVHHESAIKIHSRKVFQKIVDLNFNPLLFLFAESNSKIVHVFF